MANAEEKTIANDIKMKDGELQLALMKLVSEQNQEKFLEYDCETDTATMSTISNGTFKELEKIEGYYKVSKLEMERVAEEDREVYRKEIERCLKRSMSRVFDVRYLNEKGEKIWHRVYLVSIADDNRKVKKLAARFISIHKEKLAADLLRLQAERDSLTGVYNHKTYEEVARDIIRKHKDGVLFLMVDIDNFKEINDTYGHHAGDSVISLIGEVLHMAIKDQGVAGRIGGDEFSLCMHGMWNKEEAAALCFRIKDALKKTKENISFSISIGAARTGGRICTYEDLHFEADEALYFAKEHGKNQVVFSEEISQKKRELLEEQRTEATSEEELDLDQTLDYCVIVEPGSKKILYMNQPARKVLGMTLEQAKALHCHELFMGRCKECDVCQLSRNRVHVLDEQQACQLNQYIPEGKFIIRSRYYIWKDQPARIITFWDINDGKHVEQSFEQELETQDTIAKCWNVIHETTSQEVDYAKVLKVLTEYYDADCCAIISKEGEKYKDVFEYHRSSAEGVAEGIRKSLADEVFPKMEVLIDEEGFMRRRHIERKLLENLDLIEQLEKGFVHNTLGIKLARLDQFVGVLLVINPRHHMDDYSILKRIGIFFTTDLLRKVLSDDKDYESSHDVLTRLWSRAYFGEWQAKFGSMFKKDFGIFTTDIMHLSNINKEFGYENGNKRLVAMADMYRKVFAGYSVFRYDDDQMMAICHNTDKNAFQKLVNYAKEQMAELDVEISCGFAWTGDGELADVLREANKELEKDRNRLENNNDTEGKTFKLIKNGVLEQIGNGNFRVYLQPKVSVSTGKTVGGEALIRLFDDVRGMVAPAFFIPILEERGAVYIIDLFVLEQVFRFQKEALEEGKEVVPISVNFSKNTLMFQYLLERIKELCKLYPIPEGLIEIEITETISSMDQLVVNEIANNLRNMGFSVSMDDFGTKYSNMGVLTQFEFDTVKIDRSLLMDIERNKKNVTILKHTLEMLKDLGIHTVMEGVETKEQVEILQQLGCETIQGYYYGRPEPMEKFYELYM